MTTREVPFGGSVEAGWEAVAEAFRRNFATGEDTGASVAVYHRGRKVVDLHGGFVNIRSAPGKGTLVTMELPPPRP